MNKLYTMLFTIFFSSSLISHAAEDFQLVAIGDINECHVRKTQTQNPGSWAVHDPKFEKRDNFNSLKATVYQQQDTCVITSITFSENNSSKIRAVNAFLNALTIGKLLSTSFYVWIDQDAETPYQETLLGKLLTTRFGFAVSDKPRTENFTPLTEGKGGYLKGTLPGIRSNIIM